MKRNYLLCLLAVPLLLCALILVYGNQNTVQAQSLVANGWSDSFYSAMSANGNASGGPYNLAKNVSNFPPHLMLPGNPPWVLNPGSPPALAPTNPVNGVAVAVSGFAPQFLTATITLTPSFTMTATITVTANLQVLSPGESGSPVAGTFEPPFEFPDTTCKTSTFASVTGLPYGPFGISWSAVNGATAYVVAIAAKGLPPTPQLNIVLASTVVPAPATHVSLSVPKAEVDAVVKAHGTFVIIVNPQNDTDGICIITRRISTVPRPTSTPTSTPVPPTSTPPPPPPQQPQSGSSGSSKGSGKTCHTDPLNGGQICN